MWVFTAKPQLSKSWLTQHNVSTLRSSCATIAKKGNLTFYLIRLEAQLHQTSYSSRSGPNLESSTKAGGFWICIGKSG
jgi:hypothetical protein